MHGPFFFFYFSFFFLGYGEKKIQQVWVLPMTSFLFFFIFFLVILEERKIQQVLCLGHTLDPKPREWYPSMSTTSIKQCFCWPRLTKAIRILCLDSFIEYSSLKGFWPLCNNRSIFTWGFLKDDNFGLCWNLRLVIIEL